MTQKQTEKQVRSLNQDLADAQRAGTEVCGLDVLNRIHMSQNRIVGEYHDKIAEAIGKEQKVDLTILRRYNDAIEAMGFIEEYVMDKMGATYDLMSKADTLMEKAA